MKPVILFLISQSILLPIIIGLIRFKTIRVEYQPFFWLLVMAFFSELVSFVVIKNYISNAIPTNIFVLAEWLLLAYQFHAWGFLKKEKKFFYAVCAFPVLVWIVENIIFRKITVFSPYFRILYAFLITLMSITEINYKITHDNKNLFRSPRFLICIGLILFFVYQILYEWAYQVSIIKSPTNFTITINSLFSYMDALTNIIFGIAFLVTPRQRQFILE